MRSLRKSCLLLFAASLLVPALTTVAQEPQPVKYEGTWYQLIHVQFKTGMRDEALEHIAQNFAPAGVETGTGPKMVLLHHSGEYDMTLLWELKGGPADLAWERSPDDVKWAKSMAARHGGMEGMQKAWQEYQAMVEHAKVEIVRTWSPMAAADEEGGESDQEMDEE